MGTNGKVSIPSDWKQILDGTDWRQIKGWDDYYVDRKGNVKSVKKIYNRNWKRKTTVEKLLARFTVRGYLAVNLIDGERRKLATVHRLVAEAFIPNPDNKPQINHKDGNKTNSDVTNLEWCTPSENEKHSYKVLGKKSNLEGVNPKIFDDDQVKSIKSKYLSGASRAALATEYGCSVSTIRNVVLELESYSKEK